MIVVITLKKRYKGTEWLKFRPETLLEDIRRRPNFCRSGLYSLCSYFTVEASKMSTDRSDPSLAYTIPYQLTKKIHRNVPEGLLPEKDENSQKGKIIVITGGATGIGEVRRP